MSFRITGLPRTQFEHLFGRSDDRLAAEGAERLFAAEKPGAPCRVTLEDAEPGEPLLLLNYEHQPHDTPYRSRHAIFVREQAGEAWSAVGVIPPALEVRTLSIRAFDAGHRMIGADLAEGADAEALIDRLFARADAAYLQAHYARRGCFAARVDRC